jgi:hypothetical protein
MVLAIEKRAEGHIAPPHDHGPLTLLGRRPQVTQMRLHAPTVRSRFPGMQRAHTWCVRALHNLETRMKESSRSGDGQTRLSRRTVFAGATTVGALAAAATVLPRVESQGAAAVEPKAAPKRGGGYTLSEHNKHYYRTTRI